MHPSVKTKTITDTKHENMVMKYVWFHNSGKGKLHCLSRQDLSTVYTT